MESHVESRIATGTTNSILSTYEVVRLQSFVDGFRLAGGDDEEEGEEDKEYDGEGVRVLQIK